ncbi:hypothetical protein B0T14DRAFT_599137 [Immersiella caudata]|uniref:2EXR domain-containing protein n=1 Tax=Immersiella caudata TaxID=314043 RepID=A0AA40CE23_9PEZI|nr:hypothetical protein B0T14DRAFT_599137 [Immersiella caudata]
MTLLVKTYIMMTSPQDVDSNTRPRTLKYKLRDWFNLCRYQAMPFPEDLESKTGMFLDWKKGDWNPKGGCMNFIWEASIARDDAAGAFFRVLILRPAQASTTHDDASAYHDDASPAGLQGSAAHDKASPPTAIAEFPQFRWFPREIRDAIWNFAIRSKGKRGAHYFTLFSRKYATEKQREEWSKYLVLSKSIRPEVSLAAPTLPDGWQFPSSYRRVSEPSWYRDNCSTYIVDSGLWTACKESREAMVKHFRRTELFQIRRPLRRPGYTEVETIFSPPLNVRFGDQNTPTYFTVYPMSDLFIIQESNLHGLFLNGLFNTMSLLYQSSDAFLGHIAFELGPYNKNEREKYFSEQRIKWLLESLSLQSLERFTPVLPSASRIIQVESDGDSNGGEGSDDSDKASGIVRRAAPTYLWLIDRTLPLDTENLVGEAERFVFYGNDCRYVEVEHEADFQGHPVLDSEMFRNKIMYLVARQGAVDPEGSVRWSYDRIGILRCEPWTR